MDGDFEKRLHKAICDSFDLDELAQLVRFHLNQRIEQISKGGRLDVVVFDLIQWAAPQPRMAGLPVHAAQFKSEKNARVAALEDIRAEFEATADRPGPAEPGIKPGLPDELAQLLRTYEAIPRLIEDGPARLALMEQTANKIRALQLSRLGLPDMLHLSDSPGERLAAVLALEQTSDVRYLRWLAERVACEPPFVGHAATIALTNAAYELQRGMLGRARACALIGLDLMPNTPETARRRTQLQRAVQVADRRTGTMSRSQDILFDEVISALVEAFQPVDLQSLLKAQLDIAMDKLVRLTNRPEGIVFDLLFTADTAGWDHDLVRVAFASRPGSIKLKDLSAKYSRVG
jgi:hypothetical protein